jgi:hypothetical protein
MVKAKLLEVKFLVTLTGGLKYGCNGLNAAIRIALSLILIESACTQDITNILNRMS